MKGISACSFPTTVVLIDDKRQYLESLDLKLNHKRFTPLFFHDAKKALEFLQKDCHCAVFTQRCLSRDDTDLDHRKIEVDVPAIRKEIYNPDRFAQISVIVADYAMPGFNGTALCKQLKDKPFKKILLTGEADDSVAVRAFNDGVIDKFIRKDDSNFYALLNAAILELQQLYFQDLSSIVMNALAADAHVTNIPNIAGLNDPAFIRLFNQFCQENAIVEYYLTDTCGSHIFLDADASPGWLAIKDEEGMELAYDVAQSSNTTFPSHVLEAMQSRKKILYLYEKGGVSEDAEECQRSLHPAKKFEGTVPFYYSFIEDPNAYPIQRDQILSYNEYSKRQHLAS